MAELGTLEVRLVAGKGMKNTEFLGKNDPYAIVSYKTQDQKSTTIEGGGSDPRWDQSFFFNVDDENADVTIKFFDEDKYSADDNIGIATIPLRKVLADLEVAADLYDIVRPSGHKHGQVEVALKFTPKPAEQRPSTHHHIPHHHDSHPSQHFHHGSSNGPYGDNTEGGWK